jgi:hypothetical protein
VEPMNPSEFESPFVDRYAPSPVGPSPSFVASESPFLDEYHLGSDDEDAGPLHADPMDEIAAELLDELEDDEFDDAIHELVDEASDVRLSEVTSEVLDAAEQARTEQLLRAHFEPLASEAESLIDRVSEIAEAPSEELDAAIEQVEVGPSPSPAFEHFLSRWKNKLKKLAGNAVSLAKKGLAVAAGPLIRGALAKLRPIVRPMLEKVIKLALDKISPKYRPYLLKLAARFGLGRALQPKAAEPKADAASDAAEPAAAAPAATQTPPSEEPSAPDASAVQEELDLEIVQSLLGDERSEAEAADASSHEEPGRDPLHELDAARARFVTEVASLPEGEDVQPVVERFLPAVMFAVRTGIRLIGRPKVVGFLGGLIGKLVAPLVGKDIAPDLGRAVADVGLRTLLQAEVHAEDPRRVAAEALASTVEETVRRVAALPDHVLGEPVLFEACAYEAFDAAAAANLPSQMLRPDLRETELPSTWVRLPLRGPKLYKKFGRIFDVTISPHVATAVSTFDGAPLSAFFRDRLRLDAREPVKARVHLFEAIPRTRLARIARSEIVRGLGSSQRWAWSQLHPLTISAAASLLGAPRLGREMADEADPNNPRVGERYYFLEINEAPARPLGHGSHVHVTLNLAKGHLRVCLYLSEVVAQTIAPALRRKAATGAIVGELRSLFAGPVRTLLSGKSRRAFRLIGLQKRARSLAPAAELALRALRRQIAARALAWSWVAIAKHIEANAAEFLRMADGPEDGVRIAVTFEGVPRAAELARAFSGDLTRAVSFGHDPAPAASIRIFSGPKHDG